MQQRTMTKAKPDQQTGEPVAPSTESVGTLEVMLIFTMSPQATVGEENDSRKILPLKWR